MVKTMYSKEVTSIILAEWAKGASAEETRKHLQEQLGIKPCLNTIYAHRNGLTAQQLIDELLRQQQRDITKELNSEVRMKYRNELLKILLPQRIESYSESYSKEEKNVNVNVEGLLAQYEDLFEEATILENAAPEPVHPPQANRKTGAIPPT